MPTNTPTPAPESGHTPEYLSPPYKDVIEPVLHDDNGEPCGDMVDLSIVSSSGEIVCSFGTLDCGNDIEARTVIAKLFASAPTLAAELEQAKAELKAEREQHQNLARYSRELENDLNADRKQLDSQAAELEQITKSVDEKIDKALDAEQWRWQQEIDKILSPIYPDRDGSGTDTGDPLDLTTCEIEQTIGHLREQYDATLATERAKVERLREALDKVVDESNESQHENGVPTFGELPYSVILDARQALAETGGGA